MAESAGDTLRRLRESKGQPISIVPTDPTVKVPDDIDPTKTVEQPNPNPVYRYLYADGTYVDIKTDPEPEKQVVVGGTALTSAAREDAGAAGDKPFALGGKLVQRQPDGTYKVVYDPATDPGDKPIEIGGRIVQKQPDGSYRTLWSPPEKRTPPSLDLGAPRAGQRTDLALVEAQANAYAQQLAADPSLTDEQRNQRWQQYLATTVQPAVQRATDEVNAEADRKRREQEADTARAVAREERLDTAAERTEARTFAEFQQRAGQNAVSNALALLPYRANPLFLQQYAAGLNTLAGGGGTVNFTPEAFQVPLPDLDALAAQGAERAAALYRAAGGIPVAARPGAPASGGTGAPAMAPAPAYTSMPGAPGSPLYPPSPEAALEAIPLARRPPQV